MLLANQFTINLGKPGSPFSTITINDGIGRFANSRGTIHTTPTGKTTSNVTITYST